MKIAQTIIIVIIVIAFAYACGTTAAGLSQPTRQSRIQDAASAPLDPSDPFDAMLCNIQRAKHAAVSYPVDSQFAACFR